VIPRRRLALLLLLPYVLSLAWLLATPRPGRSQAVDVFLNVMAGGAKKLNITIPEFTLVAGRDAQGVTKKIPDVAGADLKFSALFSVVSALRRSPRATGRPSSRC